MAPRYLIASTSLVAALCQPTVGQSPAVETRVKSLIAVLSDRDAAGEKLERTREAIAELVKIGEPAVPLLVKTVVEADPKDGGTFNGNGSAYSALALDRIGKPAVGYVQALWPKLSEVDRWKLMRFRGQHDYAEALPFALASLDSRSETVCKQAVWFLGQYKEAMARRVLLDKLNTAPPRVRWEIIESLVEIRGEEVIDALVKLLDPDSWAAKGEGHPAFPGGVPPWWPDGRPRVISALRRLKAHKAAPVVLSILQSKGPGKAYMGSVIIPYLADFGTTGCIAELRLIDAARPEDFAESLGTPIEIKQMAKDAIRKIARRTS